MKDTGSRGSLLKVVIFADKAADRSALRMQVEQSNVAECIAIHEGLPCDSHDPVLHNLVAKQPHVVIVDVASRNSGPALHALSLLKAQLPKVGLFAVGDVAEPHTIIAAMRSGATEFLLRPCSDEQLLEAFVRLSSLQNRATTDGQRGKIIAVINAKGGSGSTSVAANTGLALQAITHRAAIVDLAMLGHIALHFNMRPQFTIQDVLQSVHRMDETLLDGFVNHHSSGLHFVAGLPAPAELQCSRVQLARLFDVLSARYAAVVVDLSSRLDPITRLVTELSQSVLVVAQPEVTSLWSASKVCQFASNGAAPVRLVLNRSQKIPGFSDADIEKAAGAKLLCKIPNQFNAVSSGIQRGVPVSQNNHSEISRCYMSLAAQLSDAPLPERKGWSFLRSA